MFGALGVLLIIALTSSLGALAILLTILWIALIIDSIDRKQYLWTIIILFGHFLGSLLYIAIVNPKFFKQKNKQVRIAIWASAIIALVFSVLGVSFLMFSHSDVQHDGTESFTGRLVNIDLSKTPADGDGIYTVKDETGSVLKVHLPSGPNSCDQKAIAVNGLNVGDKVRVNANVQFDKTLTVCERGTYIIKD